MNLIQLRQKKGINQTELADMTGISQASISLIESGKTYPKADFRYAIETALNADVDWMATRLNGFERTSFLAIPGDQSPEERILRETEIFVRTGKQDESVSRYSFIIEYCQQKIKMLKLIEKFHQKKQGEEVNITKWEMEQIDLELELRRCRKIEDN